MNTWHIITGEYPPDRGGVADYTRQVAEGLVQAGDGVHVWCPGNDNTAVDESGISVHRNCGHFAPSDLRRLGAALDRYPAPRRLLLQYVPHAFFCRSLNAALAAWVWWRARRRGDVVHLMVHEAFLAFEGSFAQHAAALVHRAMAVMLLDAATKVWVAIPAWQRALAPFALRGPKQFGWLPVPSNIPVCATAPRPPNELPVVGHFGTYGKLTTDLLTPIFAELAAGGGCRFLAIGRGSEAYRESVPSEWRHLVTATGDLAPEAISRHLQTCDVLVQPYPDGISTRRTTAMAALAHGIPLVSNHGARTEENIWGGVATLAAPVSLARAAQSLIGVGAAGRALIAQRQRRLYRDRFDLKHTIAALRSGVVPNDVSPELEPTCESYS